MEDMFHIQVKDKLFGEDWLKSFATEMLEAKYEKKDVLEVMKGLTHLNEHQKLTCSECYRTTKRCLIKLLMFIHIKGYTLALTQMPSLCIPCLTQSNQFEDFQKGVWLSCWTWCLSTTTREWIGVILIHHSKEGQQSTLDQQLTSTEQYHKM